jgi:hypothetical protein
MFKHFCLVLWSLVIQIYLLFDACFLMLVPANYYNSSLKRI